jgi:hypothetical protein
MTTDEQHQLVLEHLERRDQIAKQTREQLAEREKEASLDPLGDIPSEVRRQAEDSYYEHQGRHRYITSDGRTMFLTSAEIEQRRQAKTHRDKRKPRYYGMRSSESDNTLLNVGFNVLSVVLALLVVYLILH